MPKIITIHGPMAVGKSTITELLRKKLPDYVYVDRPYIKRGLKPLGKKLALKISKDASYDIIRQIMKLNRDIIVQEVSPVSLKKKLKHYLKRYKYEVYAFYLACSMAEAKKREKGRTKKARPRLLEEIHKAYSSPSKHEQVINTEKLSARRSVNFILRNIKEKEKKEKKRKDK